MSRSRFEGWMRSLRTSRMRWSYHCGRLKVLLQRLADSRAISKSWSHKSYVLNNIRKMCVRMDKGRLPTVLKALEAIEDVEPEVATTLFKELHATLTTKVTIEISPVKRTRTENTVIAQPPAAAATVTATSTPPKPKQMQAESSTRRQPQRSSKKTAAGVQRADENVIAHEQKQADEVEVTNLVSDEDDDVDMKDELDLRHEGMQ